MNKTLDDLRKKIDNADEEIIDALAKRMNVVREVGKLKKELHMPPLDKNRWQQVVNKIAQKARKQNLPEDLVKNIYEILHEAALKVEKEYE